MCLHLTKGVLCKDMVINSNAAEHTIFYLIHSHFNFDTDFVNSKFTIRATFINVYTSPHKAWGLVYRDMLTHSIAADHANLIHNKLISSNAADNHVVSLFQLLDPN